MENLDKKDKKSRGPSKTAETMAVVRSAESKKPEGERICYDPYASRFISAEVMAFMNNYPEKYRAFVALNERLIPGAFNSIVARVRYFDDVCKSSVDGGLEQLVILGAGYDTRAYRIEGLKKIRVFEGDHPATQQIKKDRIKEIFGSLPDHVTYIPVDIAVDDLGKNLLESGYERSKKTLFIMEGFLMYLPPGTVDATLSFILHNSGKGSAILFDYIPASVVNGTCEPDTAKNWRKGVADMGEPFLFGIEDGGLVDFLFRRGFTNIKNVAPDDYNKMYFHGKNEGKTINRLSSFAYAIIE
jgi:methyltransferase (TIGR00027 family)